MRGLLFFALASAAPGPPGASAHHVLDGRAHAGTGLALAIVGSFVGAACVVGGIAKAWNSWRNRRVLPV